MANGKWERKKETEKGRFYEEGFFNLKYNNENDLIKTSPEPSWDS